MTAAIRGNLKAGRLAVWMLAMTCVTARADKAATEYLAGVMDQYHTAFYVYDDYLSAGNHFIERGLMCNPGDEASLPPMNEACTNSPHTGLNCIRCEFKAVKSNWGGWFFLNGVLRPNASGSELNWGDAPNAGCDLRGATHLTFWARGEKGGEKVKFFAFGTGRNPISGAANKPYPDSDPQVSTPFITLTADWRPYTIDLQNRSLTNVLLGFAWMTKSTINGHKDVAFYLDDIAFDKQRLDQPRLLVSYRAQNSGDEFDTVLRNTAFTYDNALATLALLGAGNVDRALLIADALVYAQRHDRYYSDGRIRNAYQGGDLALAPGWTPNNKIGATRLPGWWDTTQRKWLEDQTMVGTYAGNMAWSMIALLACYEASGNETYLAAADKMGLWVEKHCRDARGAGGYTGGYEGWEPAPTRLMYKSTEHNLDLYAAFMRMYRVTGQEAWRERADHAGRFVNAMWDAREGKFWTGTGDDGVTIYREVVPVDVQAWALLAMKEDGVKFSKGLEYAETRLRVGDGFDFNQDHDGVWYEGTAQMAAAFQCLGQGAKSRAVIDFMKSAQDASGGIVAANREAISTGFYFADGSPWLYYKRLHVGATSWLSLAERGQNPFWLGSAYDGFVNVANAEEKGVTP